MTRQACPQATFNRGAFPPIPAISERHVGGRLEGKHRLMDDAVEATGNLDGQTVFLDQVLVAYALARPHRSHHH